MFPNFICGEVHYLSGHLFEVICVLCQVKCDFIKFPKHFQSEHQSEKPIEESKRYLSLTTTNPVITTSMSKEELVPLESTDDLRGIFHVALEEEYQKMVCENKKALTNEKTMSANNMELLESNQSNCDTEGSKIEINETTFEKEKSKEVSTDTELRNENDDIKISSNNTENDEKMSEHDRSNSYYACDRCDRRYKLKNSLLHHKKFKHTDKKRVNSKTEHNCKECGVTFKLESHLRGHMRKHTGIFCDICGKQFTQLGNMNRHKIRHTGVKDFKCQICDYTFFTEKELNAHMLRHTQAYQFICEVCGKRCRDSGVLTAHMRRHTGERPAKCDVCEKSFFSYHDLNVHKVIHSEERPFVCDECGATFQRKKSLRVHKKTHSNIKAYVCTICSKAFTQSSSLNAHIKCHESAEKLNKLIAK